MKLNRTTVLDYVDDPQGDLGRQLLYGGVKAPKVRSEHYYIVSSRQNNAPMTPDRLGNLPRRRFDLICDKREFDFEVHSKLVGLTTFVGWLPGTRSTVCPRLQSSHNPRQHFHPVGILQAVRRLGQQCLRTNRHRFFRPAHLYTR